jgi:predicted RNA-binding Zn-ribbon protein involved in translation (DUF1610 family)
VDDPRVVECVGCGESVAVRDGAEWSYCPGCGTRLSGRRRKRPQRGERYAYKPSRIFDEAGTAMKQCEQCATVVAAAAEFCPGCGSRFLPEGPSSVVQVQLGSADYLGGYAPLGSPRKGGLAIRDAGVFFGSAKIAMELIESVDVSGGQVAKSRVGATLAFGVIGLATKGTVDRAELGVRLRSGETAFFLIERATPFEVRAKLAPFLNAAGVPFTDEVQDREAAREPGISGEARPSLVDELERLADLHERGFLSIEEVAAAKAKLLGSTD